MKTTKTKAYDMVKSVLPSRGAKQAKAAKDKLHRQNRRTSNYQCNKFKGYADEVAEIYEDNSDDLHYYLEPHRGPGYEDIVYTRRNYDHLNHFIAWAWLKTKDIDEQSKMSWMRANCPMGLLGYHAMSHLEPYLQYDPIGRYSYYDVPSRFDNSPNASRDQREVTLQEIWLFLCDISENEKRKDAFNEALTRRYSAMRIEWVTRQLNFYPRYKSQTHNYNGFELKSYWDLTSDERAVWRAKLEAKWDKTNVLRLFRGKLDRYKFYDAVKDPQRYTGGHNYGAMYIFVVNYIKKESS